MVNRHIVDWRAASPRGSDKTEYVVLDTGEKMTSVASIEANKTATISTNGTVAVSPSSGYDSMAKATLTVAVNTKLYAWSRTSDEDIVYYVYTLTETPTTASKAYYANPDSGTDKIFQILNHTVDAVVSESEITVDSNDYTRAVAADITL